MWGEIWPFLFAIFLWFGFWIALDFFKRLLANKMRDGKLKDALLKDRGLKPAYDASEVRSAEQGFLFPQRALPGSHENYVKRSFRLTKSDPHFKRIIYIAVCALGPGLVALVVLGLNYILEWLGIVSP
jgi:hypothetical protein